MALTIRSPLLLQITPGGAGAGNTDHVISRPLVIYEVNVLPSAVQAGGTAQILRQPQGGGGYNATTDAIACAAVGAIGRVTTLTAAQATFVIGDSLRLTLAGAATNGTVHAQAWPTAIPGAS